jgi:hypothetical protein
VQAGHTDTISGYKQRSTTYYMQLCKQDEMTLQ